VPISLFYSDSAKALYGDAGCFDPWKLCWTPQASGMPADAVAVAPRDAVALLARAGLMRRVPAAVIGPRDAKPEEQATAEALGKGIGALGLQLLCGGKGGVMEAVCKGCLEAGGLPIGLQAVGPEYGDRMCIEFARAIGQVIGGFQPPRGY